MKQGTQSWCSQTTWKGGVGREMGEVRREGTCVCLWPIHTDIRQKPSQYYKALIVKLKTKKKLVIKSDREEEISHNIRYMWTLKTNDTNELTKHKETHRLIRERTYSCQQGKTR